MRKILREIEDNIHEALATGSSNILQALVEYFSTPERPITPRELAELWFSLDVNEEYQWIMFSFDLQFGADKHIGGFKLLTPDEYRQQVGM